MSRRQFAIKKGISRSNFDRYWRSYKSGKYDDLKLPAQRHRVRHGKYEPVEKLLVEFVQANKRDPNNTCLELTWNTLSSKARDIARQVLSPDEADQFKASPGWLFRILGRYGFIKLNKSTKIKANKVFKPPKISSRMCT